MKLHEGIKQMVAQFGERIVKEVRLANLLADLNAYEDYPAMRIVFREIQKEGYGTKVFLLGTTKDLEGVDKLVKKFARQTGYKEDLITYGFDSILYGLGCINTINEPLSKGFNPQSTYSDILDGLDWQLINLQREYQNLLELLITKPEDILYDAPAYYSSEAESKLYAVSSKIFALQQQLGKNDTQWCEKEKSKRIEKFKRLQSCTVQEYLNNQRSKFLSLLDSLVKDSCRFFLNDAGAEEKEGFAALLTIENQIKEACDRFGITYDNWCREQEKLRINECLDKLKSEYLSALETKIKTNKRFLIHLSGYYDQNAQNALTRLENEIKETYHFLGMAYSGWCEETKTNVLSKHKVKPAIIIAQILLKICIPTAVALSIIIYGTIYVTSLDEISKYEQAITLGEQKADKGLFADAIQTFIHAKNNYNGLYRAKHYQEVAEGHISTTIDNAIAKCQDEISQEDFINARKLIISLRNNIPKEDIENTNKLNNAQAILNKALAEGLNKLIDNIAKNKGHLDAQAKKLLDELLAVNPNDYWLNFLKNKEK